MDLHSPPCLICRDVNNVRLNGSGRPEDGVLVKHELLYRCEWGRKGASSNLPKLENADMDGGPLLVEGP